VMFIFFKHMTIMDMWDRSLITRATHKTLTTRSHSTRIRSTMARTPRMDCSATSIRPNIRPLTMQAISFVTITTLLDNLVKYNTFLTSMWLVQEVVLWKQLVVVEDTVRTSSDLCLLVRNLLCQWDTSV